MFTNYVPGYCSNDIFLDGSSKNFHNYNNTLVVIAFAAMIQNKRVLNMMQSIYDAPNSWKLTIRLVYLRIFANEFRLMK